ncbi:alpha/beta hydrolase family protein [Nocardia sp. NPDC051030]|uniref:alpha/beta hydrolase n=1 Tax=Nocardia sp. NPDC051030 TaxID=3155162 RepID=UPI003441AA62
MNRRITARMTLAVLAAAASIGLGGYPAAGAEQATAPGVTVPAVKSPDGSYIRSIQVKDDRNIRLTVYSAAMDQSYPVDVLRPADTSAPRSTLYLLNGAGGGVDDASWQLRTDALDFLSDKNINVVQIIGGAWSWYSDWVKSDPTLGTNKWSTYLGQELPPLIDAALGTNGVNAIAGISMASLPVMNSVIFNPGLFRSAAVYSGFFQTTTDVGRQAVKAVTERYGHGNVENMWGQDDSPLWAANDPTLNAEKLRGTNLFISTGNGIPGIYDLPGARGRNETSVLDTAQVVATGAFIEANCDASTVAFQNRLNELKIPATFVYRQTGTHIWGYWQDDLKSSWPVLAQGLYSAP